MLYWVDRCLAYYVLQMNALGNLHLMWHLYQSILIKHESCLSVGVFTFFSATNSPSIMKLWLQASYHLGQLKTWRSPMFLISKDSSGFFFLENLYHYHFCSPFPHSLKVIISWHFGSMPTLGQLKTWRSPMFKILLFTDSMGLFRVFSNGVFLSKNSAILTPIPMKFGHKDYFIPKKWHEKKSEKFQFFWYFSGVFFIHK